MQCNGVKSLQLTLLPAQQHLLVRWPDPVDSRQGHSQPHHQVVKRAVEKFYNLIFIVWQREVGLWPGVAPILLLLLSDVGVRCESSASSRLECNPLAAILVPSAPSQHSDQTIYSISIIRHLNTVHFETWNSFVEIIILETLLEMLR